MSRAAELLVGATLGSRGPNKKARKFGAGVTQNLQERMESRYRNVLLDNYHVYIFALIFGIHIAIILTY